MSAQSPFFLHNVSVVVTAEYHNPSILNPDYLRIQKIVPARWVAAENVTTPALSSVSFKNGVRIVVEPNKMTVNENCDGQFGQKTLAHGIVGQYVSKLPHVPYKNVGLNCQVSMQKASPEQWLKDRFLKGGKWLSQPTNISSVSFKLKFDVKPATCMLTLDGGYIETPQAAAGEAVLVDCNFHYEGPHNAKQIKAILGTWASQEKDLLVSLKRILTGRLG